MKRAIGAIALFTVNFSHLYTYMLDFIVIQMSRVNREKGYFLTTYEIIISGIKLVKYFLYTLTLANLLTFINRKLQDTTFIIILNSSSGPTYIRDIFPMINAT